MEMLLMEELHIVCSLDLHPSLGHFKGLVAKKF